MERKSLTYNILGSACILGAALLRVLGDYVACPGCNFDGPTQPMAQEIEINQAFKLPRDYISDMVGQKGSDDQVKSLDVYTLRDGSLVFVRTAGKQVRGGKKLRLVRIASWTPGTTKLEWSQINWPTPLADPLLVSVNRTTGSLVIATKNCAANIYARESNGTYSQTTFQAAESRDLQCKEILWDETKSIPFLSMSNSGTANQQKFLRLSGVAVQTTADFEAILLPILQSENLIDGATLSKPEIEIKDNTAYFTRAIMRGANTGSPAGDQSLQMISGRCGLSNGACKLDAIGPKLNIQSSPNGPRTRLTLEGITGQYVSSTPFPQDYAPKELLTPNPSATRTADVKSRNDFNNRDNQRALFDLQQRQPYRLKSSQNTANLEQWLRDLQEGENMKTSEVADPARTPAGSPGRMLRLGGVFYGPSLWSKSGLLALSGPAKAPEPDSVPPIGRLVCLTNGGNLSPVFGGDSGTPPTLPPIALRFFTQPVTANIQLHSPLNGAPYRLVQFATPEQKGAFSDPNAAFERALDGHRLMLREASDPDALCTETPL
jgi:hypothetical protein